MFNEIRGLSQAVIQNGGSLYDVIELYTTNSVRQMKKVFKTLKERQEQLQDQTNATKATSNLNNNNNKLKLKLLKLNNKQQEKIANDNYQAELDRINKKEIALIAAESKAGHYQMLMQMELLMY